MQARLMERTPSMSELNEIMYGQVFLMNTMSAICFNSHIEAEIILTSTSPVEYFVLLLIETMAKASAA